MESFKEVKIIRSTVIWKDGIEILGHIAGVNSGMYEFPFVITVRTWAKKFWFKKFFMQSIELNKWEAEILYNELGKALAYFNEKSKEESKNG